MLRKKKIFKKKDSGDMLGDVLGNSGDFHIDSGS